MCITLCLSIHDGHLGGFYLLAVVNNAAVNMDVLISVQLSSFKSFGYILPRSGIAGLYSNSIFYFLRNYHTVFHSCTILYSQQQYTGVSIPLHPHEHLLFLFFFFK